MKMIIAISTELFKKTTTSAATAQYNHTKQTEVSEIDSDAPLCRSQRAQPAPGITEEEEIQIFVHVEGRQTPITISTHST